MGEAERGECPGARSQGPEVGLMLALMVVDPGTEEKRAYTVHTVDRGTLLGASSNLMSTFLNSLELPLFPQLHPGFLMNVTRIINVGTHHNASPVCYWPPAQVFV